MRVKSDRKKIRQPKAAGQFYPDDPVQLTKTIAEYFSRVDKTDIEGQILGLIAPHAGYPYSGQVAAHAYKLLEGKPFDTVVLISPSHTVFFRGASVFDGGYYRTPLGDIPIDIELVGKLTAINPRLALSDEGHTGRAGRDEHALEVHLPFLQVVLGDFMLVPIVMGDQEYETCRILGEAVGSFAHPGRTLIIASSDLSHFHPTETARLLDRKAAEAIVAFSPPKLLQKIEAEEFEACGGGPIAAAMIAAQQMGGGGTKASILNTANSGDVESGSTDRVVGYLAAVLHTDRGGVEGENKPSRVYEIDEATKMKSAPEGSVDNYTEEEKSFLKRAAANSIANAVKGSRLPALGAPTTQLAVKRGVFVTLKTRGQLRGCIGYLQALKPLYVAVQEMAQAAAVNDHRFSPVEPREIEKLEIEITVISPLVPVTDIDEILIGRHGLYVVCEFQSGVLLPQVAIENGWDRETFLTQTCIKAGLEPDSWRDTETEIYRFTAFIF